MPRHGWSRWPARGPRPWDARTSLGRPGSWRAMRVSTPPPAVPAWPVSRKARSAKSSPAMTSTRTRCATTLERRDEAFEIKIADVLCDYREAAVLRVSKSMASDVAIIAYDDKPGIQAIANTAADLPPKPGEHEGFARPHEHKSRGTLTLLAEIDMLTGKVHPRVGAPPVTGVRRLPHVARHILSRGYRHQADSG